jgi:hypothetical protein
VRAKFLNGVLGLVLALGAAAGWNALGAQTPAADYGELWGDLQLGLADFATASMQHPNGAARAAAWKEAKGRYEAALVKLIETTPPKTGALDYWRWIPLHEEMLAGMSTVVDGETAGDPDAVDLGWEWIGQARAMIRKTQSNEAPRR